MQHLTRIVVFPFGMNILGLLELLAVLAWLTFIISEFDMPSLFGGMVLLSGILSVIVFDFGWRLRQPEPSRSTRLFSPYEGGCIVYIPIWLLLPLIPAVTISSVMIIQSLSK